MSELVTLGGAIFIIPDVGESNYGQNLTNYFVAIPASVVQANGVTPMTGNLTLTSNSGIILQDSEGTPKAITLAVPSPVTTSYTLKLPGTAGSVGQVLTTDGTGITSWAAAAGGGTINSGTTAQLAYYAANGITISGETISGDATIAAGGALTISALAITNAKVATAASIALSKLASTTAYYWYAANVSGVLTPLAVTPSLAVISDSNGLPSTSTTTSTELSYVHGVTSAIQTQIGTLLPLAGGVMSGVINMASNKITSVATGTTASDAVNFGQIFYGFQPAVQATSTTEFTTTSESFTTTNLSATITPTSTSHRIKITVSGSLKTSLAQSGNAYITIIRGITNLGTAAGFGAFFGSNGTGVWIVPAAITYIDSPTTTSAVTYAVQIRNDNPGVSVAFGTEGTQVMTLEEIA